MAGKGIRIEKPVAHEAELKPRFSGGSGGLQISERIMLFLTYFFGLASLTVFIFLNVQM